MGIIIGNPQRPILIIKAPTVSIGFLRMLYVTRAGSLSFKAQGLGIRV